ncbi:hypothetical protein RHMOL_Rhmol06G0013200 [Rhododendron molle]|uniref:Uncharacterized protein n=1 Tax=Rhododendron molle TaxID=49168 RepID=A0ACC0N7G9_RHOML|nr:hypothetical protein RHMOL_Rhmol06G0013200 [Rhododendron molle]
MLSVSELVPPWEVATISMDIRDLVQEQGISFDFVRRLANWMAHEVASLAKTGKFPLD